MFSGSLRRPASASSVRPLWLDTTEDPTSTVDPVGKVERRNLGGMRPLDEFCQRTSLHGWNFCFRHEKPASHTAFWLVVIACGLGAVAFVMTGNVQDFLHSSVSFNLESPTFTLDDVLFPSLVVCNMNLLRRSFVYAMLKDPDVAGLVGFDELKDTVQKFFIEGQSAVPTSREKSILDAVLSSAAYESLFAELVDESYVDTTNITDVHSFRFHMLMLTNKSQVLGPDRSPWKRALVVELASQFRDGEMIRSIAFPGFGVFYGPAFTTDLSENCVWVSPYVKPTDDLSNLRGMKKTVFNGANNGITLLLDSEAYDYANALDGAEGFVASILHPLDIPIMKQSGIYIPPGQSVQIAVTPKLSNTTDGCRRRFWPVKRQCYFDEEIVLLHFPPDLGYRYSMDNCLFEATVQKIEADCGCTPKNFISQVNFSACEGTGKLCMEERMDAMGSVRIIVDRGQHKECLATCSDQTHSFLVNSAGFPSPESFSDRPEFCSVLTRLRAGCLGDRRDALDDYAPGMCDTVVQETGPDSKATWLWNCTEFVASLKSRLQQSRNASGAATPLQKYVAQYAKRNMVKLNIFIRDPYVEKYLTEESVTQVSFVGSVGGILGLFTGFSFVSIVEILYIFTFGRFNRGRATPAEDHKDQLFVKPIIAY